MASISLSSCSAVVFCSCVLRECSHADPDSTFKFFLALGEPPYAAFPLTGNDAFPRESYKHTEPPCVKNECASAAERGAYAVVAAVTTGENEVHIGAMVVTIGAARDGDIRRCDGDIRRCDGDNRRCDGDSWRCDALIVEAAMVVTVGAATVV